MGTVLKVFAALLIVGGIWVWTTGRSVTTPTTVTIEPGSLSASAILAPGNEYGAFDQQGTIVLDETQGQGSGGVPYILYTEYDENGSPSVKTKRLIFPNRAACADMNVPCATNQPQTPVHADESVRIVGVVKDDTVEVSEMYRT